MQRFGSGKQHLRVAVAEPGEVIQGPRSFLPRDGQPRQLKIRVWMCGIDLQELLEGVLRLLRRAAGEIVIAEIIQKSGRRGPIAWAFR